MEDYKLLEDAEVQAAATMQQNILLGQREIPQLEGSLMRNELEILFGQSTGREQMEILHCGMTQLLET